MAFGVFGGIALLGCLLSFGIRGASLEAEGENEWDEEEEDFSEEEDDQDTPLLSRE